VLLVIGSSLMVYSGYRFVRAACERGLPVALINRGKTRADAQVSVKIEAACGDVLERLAARMIGFGSKHRSHSEQQPIRQGEPR